MTEAARRADEDGLTRPDWTDGYRPPGRDEFLDGDGRVRPVWERFLAALDAPSPDEVTRRVASAERRIRDTGVSYRVYGEQRDRAWPLAALPFLLDGDEWAEMAAGIVQRARLMEALLGDLYGPGALVEHGVIPAALVAGCPDFIRPVHGIRPPGGGHWLHLYAADLVRGPDGRWTVVADRTQAPSGAGYALENRLVLSRAFPDLSAALHVARHAPFFAAFRAGLAATAGREDPRLCLLTSGPYSETYFEQAYLARYLGLLLVEGDDLTVREGRLHVRTVAGLKRADVVWRRVDSDFVDPLELNPASRLGVAGLLGTLRAGAVAMGNMPGSGLVEAAGFAPFMPLLAHRLLGEDLRLPAPRSWWCGDPEVAARAASSEGDHRLLSAYAPPRPDDGDRTRLHATLADRAFDVVMQERLVPATAPTLDGSRLAPRPFTLRVFAARSPEGWIVMPGGFCRVAEEPGDVPLTMAPGIRSADVWIVGDEPVRAVSLLPARDRVRIRRVTGHLPSRAADNLFWLGRYLERAECVVRLARALLTDLGTADETGGAHERLRGVLGRWGCVDAEDAPAGGMALAGTALSGDDGERSALAHARSATRAASSLRERLSGETWRALTGLVATLTPAPDGRPTGAELIDRAESALLSCAALSGLAGENMNRAAGWPFVDLGRRIERAINTTELARIFADGDADAASLACLLDLVDSQITFGSRYILGVAPEPVRDLALLDSYNPRSVAFQIDSIRRHLAEMPRLSGDGLPEPPCRAAASLAGTVAAAQADDLDDAFMSDLEDRIGELANLIAVRFFPGGAAAVRPEKLVGLA